MHNDKQTYICKTCSKNIEEHKIPKLCLNNGLDFPELPQCIKELNNLEERLVSPRVPFMRMMQLGHDNQKGIRGNIVNVPLPVVETVNKLPRAFSETHTIQLKFMRRMIVIVVVYQSLLYTDILSATCSIPPVDAILFYIYICVSNIIKRAFYLNH
jgi:hypothetical protein